MRKRLRGVFAIGAIVVLGAGAGPPSPAVSLWSLKPVQRPAVPPASDARVRNPIDAFLLQNLRSHQLALAPEADRRTLIRRLSFDLIGLPPAPEEVEAFLRDASPDAYERLVDRLLASPHYGERWARHWLDLVRFAETHGYERDDPKPNAWRYRDWVVRALNRDLPYDRFLTEQLAGDELADASAETRAATGMYRLGLIDDEPADTLMDRFDQLDDMVKTVGTTMLGLSIHCARCHDHKFDPISQADYYRMLAFFTPARPFVRDDLASISLTVASPEQEAAHAARKLETEPKAAPLRARIDAIRLARRDKLLELRKQTLDPETLAALGVAPERRDAARKQKIEAAAIKLGLRTATIDKQLDPKEQVEKASLEEQIKKLEQRLPPLPTALGLTDRGPTADPTRLLVRGDAHKPGTEVSPGFPASIDPKPPRIEPPSNGKSTGRRLALARWIVRPDNPLTARVMVNRLWQHHFGAGLAATPSDFGTMGEEPSNPALLDWLASEFVARGWGLKAMHRLMVTSSTYRQSSGWNSAAAQADSTCAWLWRMTPRRLEAEPIRDAVLAVAGTINLEVGGPSVAPPIDPVVLAGQSRPGSGWKTSDERASNRRSVYVYVKRSLILPELEVLDAADNAEPCPRRAVTTTAPQALTLLNSAFFNEQAGKFADRLRREVGDDRTAQVNRAFALSFSRDPDDKERRRALDFLDAQADRIKQRRKPEDRADPDRESLRALCLVLLNANEFVVVD